MTSAKHDEISPNFYSVHGAPIFVNTYDSQIWDLCCSSESCFPLLSCVDPKSLYCQSWILTLYYPCSLFPLCFCCPRHPSSVWGLIPSHGSGIKCPLSLLLMRFQCGWDWGSIPHGKTAMPKSLASTALLFLLLLIKTWVEYSFINRLSALAGLLQFSLRKHKEDTHVQKAEKIRKQLQYVLVSYENMKRLIWPTRPLIRLLIRKKCWVIIPWSFANIMSDARINWCVWAHTLNFVPL